MSTYSYTTQDLADEFGISPKTVRARAARLGLGIDLEGRAGFRYSEKDREALIESMRPAPTVKPRRRRNRRAA